MKRSLFLMIFMLILTAYTAAQAPGRFNYQAVARNTSGELIINQNISVRISILTGSPAGASEYSETHSVTSDAYGVFNLLVGGGTPVSGSFDAIAWGTASKFLKIEADVTGGTTYQTLATTQILSMPYALYANESGTKTFNDDEFSIVYKDGIADNPATAPTVVLAGMGAGIVDNGTHDYKVTFITSSGETGAGPASGSVTVLNNTEDGQIMITGIPVAGGTNVTARNVYRRYNSTGNYKLLTTINNNTTTSYIDDLANSSLGKILPSSNSTEVGIQFNTGSLSNYQIINVPDTSGTMLLEETISNILAVNNGDSFNIDGAGSVTYVFPTIPPQALKNFKYLMVNINFETGGTGTTYSETRLKVSTKNLNGVYVDDVPSKIIFRHRPYDSSTQESSIAGTYSFPHQITSLEGAEGLVLRITITTSGPDMYFYNNSTFLYGFK